MKKVNYVILVVLAMLASCGSDNNTGSTDNTTSETSSLDTNTSLLTDMDPSFESMGQSVSSNSTISFDKISEHFSIIRNSTRRGHTGHTQSATVQFSLSNQFVSDGSYSLQLRDASESTLRFPKKRDALEVKAGARYALTFDYALINPRMNGRRSTDKSINISLNFSNSDGTSVTIDIYENSIENELSVLKTYTQEFEVPSGTSRLQLDLSFGGVETIHLDNLKLVRIK